MLIAETFASFAVAGPVLKLGASEEPKTYLAIEGFQTSFRIKLTNGGERMAVLQFDGQTQGLDTFDAAGVAHFDGITVPEGKTVVTVDGLPLDCPPLTLDLETAGP